MFTGRPPRLKAFSYLGFYRYFLTFCSDGRRRSFDSKAVVDLAMLQILRAANLCEFAVIAYCFMPDHLHLLIEAESEASDCKRFIARAKQFSAFAYSQAFGGRLRQKYGYERVLRSDEDTKEVARYILANPLRAGLVQRVEDYPFLGSTRYSLAELIEGVSDPCAGPAKAGHYE